VYFDGGDDHIEGVINMAEEMSYVTCESCGAPGEKRGTGWVNTYCDACERFVGKASVAGVTDTTEDSMEENEEE
jgi:hypothetical protein